MINEQFFISLPCNSSMSQYPNNTKAHYKTELNERLIFDNEYEVALTEIIFPSIIQEEHEIGAIEVKRFALGDLKNIDDQSGFTVYTTDITHSNINKILDKINSKISESSKHFSLKTSPKLTLNYNYTTKKFFLKFNDFDSTCAILFYGHIADILNFNKSDINIENRISSGQRANLEFDHGNYTNISFSINSFYVYTDIIKYQLIGDSSKQLLRTVHVDNDKTTQNVIYITPNYIPLIKNTISQIEISIKDSQDKHIKFNSGSQQTIITLHFRPKKNGF